MCINMDDLFIISNDTFEKYLDISDGVLLHLEKSRMQANAVNSKWACNYVIYLVFVVIREGINLKSLKPRAIIVIQTPKKKLQLRCFIGVVHFYSYLWKKKLHTLEPLSKLPQNCSFVKMDVQQIECVQIYFKITNKETVLLFRD